MNDQKNVNKRLLRNDVLLILVLLIVSLAGFLYLFVFRSSGNVVRVTVDGEIWGEYSLAVEHIEDIYTEENGHNRLVIKDGKAYMESASCPDGICVDHRPVFRNGESIVCLPNRVVATVITDEADEPDIVA